MDDTETTDITEPKKRMFCVEMEHTTIYRSFVWARDDEDARRIAKFEGGEYELDRFDKVYLSEEVKEGSSRFPVDGLAFDEDLGCMSTSPYDDDDDDDDEF